MPIKLVSPVRISTQGGRHVFSCENGELGRLQRSEGGGVFTPPEGLPLRIRPEPGITASHFQMWNEKDAVTTEFFASSYRVKLLSRDIRVHYGNNDYHLVPRAGWSRGYELIDNKSKRILSITPASAFGSDVLVTLDKEETELACIVFTYFLAGRAWLRSLWPGKTREEQGDRKVAQDAATKAATAKAAELAQAMMPGNVPKAGVERPAAPAKPAEPAKPGEPAKRASAATSNAHPPSGG